MADNKIALNAGWDSAIYGIAERIRALGQAVPGSYTQSGRRSSVPEQATVPSAEEMVRELVEGHETS